MEQENSKKAQYTLHISRAEDVCWKPGLLHGKKPTLFVEVSIGDFARKTKASTRDLSPAWNEDIVLPVHAESTALQLSLILQHRSSYKNHVTLGSAQISASDLVGSDTTGDTMISVYNKKRKQIAKLYLRLSTVEAGTTSSREVLHAIRDTDAIQPTGSAEAAIAGVKSIAGVYEEGAEFCRNIGTLVETLDVVKAFGDDIAKIHPYVNAAWKVATVLYQAISAQMKVDQSVVALADKLSKALDFALDANSLKDRIAVVESAVVLLFNQITECCVFIREYSGKGFTARVATTGYKEKVNSFVQALHDLRQDISQGYVVQTGITTARMAGEINDIFLKGFLNPDLEAMAIHGRPSCLAGTRVSTLQEIVDWLLNDPSQSIFWLYGTAGCGKSTISRSIQERMRQLSRLGAYVTLQRGRSTVSGIVKAVVYQLARFDSHIASAVTDAISGFNSTSDSLTSQELFTEFMQGPLAKAADSLVGPVVVVIDALDECGTVGNRKSLIELLEGFTKVNRKFRFLLTSRPEHDLYEACTSSTWSESVRSMEFDCASKETRENVAYFVKHELKDEARKYEGSDLLNEWTSGVEKLANASAGLFLSASTAVEMIKRKGDPLDFLQSLLTGTVRLDRLDDVYSEALRVSGIDWTDTASRSWFQAIVGFILLAKTPIGDTTIDDILEPPPAFRSRFILEKLQALLYFETGGGKAAAFRHVTIADFFRNLDSTNTISWALDLHMQRFSLAKRCLLVMKRLRFNICHLESSFCPNSAIHDLQDRVEKNIAPSLQYACLYWGQHLKECREPQRMGESEGVHSSTLLNELDSFLRGRLLFWAEALSLFGTFDASYNILTNALAWIKDEVNGRIEIAAFLRASRDLLSTFRQAISYSALHVYVSMLSLMHNQSAVAAHYHQYMKQTGIETVVHLHQSLQSRPLARSFLRSLGSQGSHNSHVAFSPNKSVSIAAMCNRWTGKMSVWDVDTGELKSQVADNISFLVFSCDGKWLVTGSTRGVIKVWDTQHWTSEVIDQQDTGSWGSLTAMASSPEPYGINQATVIASASWKSSLKIYTLSGNLTYKCTSQSIWDISSQEPARIDLIVFRPRSASQEFVTSSDSSHSKNSILLWRGTVYRPILSDNRITAMAFTSDGSRLLYGGGDGKITILDMENLNIILQTGPDYSPVASLTITPDGAQFASTSSRGDFKLWDLATLQICSEDILPGTGSISGNLAEFDLAWSMDGRYLVASIADVPVYDASTIVAGGQATAELAQSIPRYSHVSHPAVSCDGTGVATVGAWYNPFRRSVSVWKEGKNGRWDTAYVHDLWDFNTCDAAEYKTGVYTFVVGTSYDSSISAVAAQWSSGSHPTIWVADKDTIFSWRLAHTSEVVGIMFEPTADSSTLAIFGNNGIEVWSVTSSSSIFICRLGNVMVKAMDFSSVKSIVAVERDGNRALDEMIAISLGTTCSDSRIRIWDVSDLSSPSSQVLFEEFEVSAIQYSPDGQFICAAAPFDILQWDLNGNVIARFSYDNQEHRWDARMFRIQRRFMHFTAEACYILAPKGYMAIYLDPAFDVCRLVPIPGESRIITSVFLTHYGPWSHNFQAWDSKIDEFSVENSRAVSISNNYEARVWDMRKLSPQTAKLRNDGWVTDGEALIIWLPPHLKDALRILDEGGLVGYFNMRDSVSLRRLPDFSNKIWSEWFKFVVPEDL